jgi:murein L,D-transpeptidase YafK
MVETPADEPPRNPPEAAGTSPPARRSRRPLVPVALLVLVLIAGLAIAMIDKPHLLFDPERRALEITRAHNVTLARLGRPLPGTPDLARLDQRLAEHGVKLGAAIMIRIFKAEHELEIWLARDGRFHRFATYPICRWSGGLGPKLATGDRQAPEGFYSVSAAQLNPNSRWYRSFNLGFPNAYDRAHGRTGSALMVHGGCSSAGCYAMTNPVIEEIWKLVTAALAAGQKRFQVQAFPFRLSDEALAAKSAHPDAVFWRTLKRGHDIFDETQLPPTVTVCAGTYRFRNGSGPPELTGTIETGCGSGRTASQDGKKAKKAL